MVSFILPAPVHLALPVIVYEWSYLVGYLWKPATLQVTGSSKHEDSPVSRNWLKTYSFILNWVN